MQLLRNTSLQRKITGVMMLTAITTLLIAVTALLVLEADEFKESVSREIESIAQVIGGSSKAALEFDDRKSAVQTLSVLKDDSRIISAALYSADGLLFASYESDLGKGTIQSTSFEQRGLTAQDTLAVWHPIIHQRRNIGSVYIQATSREVYERLVRHASIAGMILVVSVIAAYLLSAALRNLISKPIVTLAETARRVSERGDYSLRVTKESDDETGELVDQFNHMLEKVQTSTHALRASEHQLRLITDSLPVMIAYVNSDQRYEFNNAAYEKWFGLAPAQLKGRHVREVVGENAYMILLPHIEAALSGNTVTFEHAIEYPGHSERFISFHFIPDFDDDGSVRGYFALITDITDRKQVENELKILNTALEERVVERTRQLESSQERLRHSERLASIGTLAAGVAHEIRNPLNSILLATQVAARYHGKLDKALQDILVAVSNEARRCAAIIKNVLLFAKSEKTERSIQDINEVVKHAADLARSYLGNTKAQLLLQLDEQSLPVSLNSTEIEQVLINLINNAAESTPQPVKIEIETRRSAPGVQLMVRDNGPGIPADMLKHIFDPFFSTKRQKGNTGLGLSLSHGIIVDHGGSLNVQSGVGHGTTFTIDFPEVES